MERMHWRRFLLAGLLVIGVLVGTAWAAEGYPQTQPLTLTESYGARLIQTDGEEGPVAPASIPAAVLYRYGLLEGTATAGDKVTLDVDKTLTRHEGVTMLVRLMGKEAEARAGSWDTPFTDVADWAAPYVGYAYANGIANGTSATTFSGTARMSREQFVTMVLRALGWSDQAGEFSWSDPDPLAGEEGLLCPLLSETGFYRGDAIFICYEALDAQVKGSGTTLLERLTQQGAIQDRGVVTIYAYPDLRWTEDGLAEELDYLRKEFGVGALLDFTQADSIPQVTDWLLAYCEERGLEAYMPGANLLFGSIDSTHPFWETAGALSAQLYDYEEEQLGREILAYDREAYLLEAEFLADKVPRALWQMPVSHCPAEVDSRIRLYGEKGLLLSGFFSNEMSGLAAASGEGREGPYLLERMEELYALYGQLVDEDMTDYEKVEAIYQGVMARTAYNYDVYEEKTTDPRDVFLAHSWMGFVEGSDVVCEGYAEAISALMDMAGIPNVQVSGEGRDGSSGHAWNKVQLDGVWYNLDATWGDTGRNPSAYFLRSDAAFQRDGHEDFIIQGETDLYYPAPRDYQ